jgi:hypothetical protein
MMSAFIDDCASVIDNVSASVPTVSVAVSSDGSARGRGRGRGRARGHRRVRVLNPGEDAEIMARKGRY